MANSCQGHVILDGHLRPINDVALGPDGAVTAFIEVAGPFRINETELTLRVFDRTGKLFYDGLVISEAGRPWPDIPKGCTGTLRIRWLIQTRAGKAL